MKANKTNVSRREALVRGATWLANITMVPMLAASQRAGALKVQKSDFFYQDHPKDGKSCSQCKLFVPDQSSLNEGSCGLIEGTISSNGWCMAYSPG